MSIDRWMDKEEVVNIYNRIVLSRKKELKMPFAATLMDLEIIILSRVSQPCMCAQSFSCVRLFATPWTVACQPPLSTGFSRQEYRTGLPFLLPGDLPDPGIEPASPVSPALQADSSPQEEDMQCISWSLKVLHIRKLNSWKYRSRLHVPISSYSKTFFSPRNLLVGNVWQIQTFRFLSLKWKMDDQWSSQMLAGFA